MSNMSECDDDCCICLGGHQGDFMSIPGCGHRMHVRCVLQIAQTGPLRCPVCRNEPIPIQNSDERERAIRATFNEFIRERRLRNARRRRLLHSRTDLREKWEKLKTLRQDIQTQAREGQHMYEQKCRDVFRNDAEIQNVKRKMRNMRRRELRLMRYLEQEIVEFADYL